MPIADSRNAVPRMADALVAVTRHLSLQVYFVKISIADFFCGIKGNTCSVYGTMTSRR